MTGFTYGGNDGSQWSSASYSTLSGRPTADSTTSAFAYGTVNGAQLSGDDGGTWSERIVRWAIGPSTVDVTSVELTPSTMSLSFQVGRDRLEHWRRLDRTGNVTIEVGFAGAFETIDRAGRDGPTTITPPEDHQPPFDRADWYINSYQETQQAADRFEIALTFQRVENRADVFDPVDEAGGPWLIENDRGTIALEDRRVRQSSNTGTTAGGTVALPVTVDDLQAATIADIAGYPDGVVEREVPDGENFFEDTTGGRQTVAIDAPSEAGFESGKYYIQNWSLSLSGYDDDRWLVDLELAKDQRDDGFGRGFGVLFGQ